LRSGDVDSARRAKRAPIETVPVLGETGELDDSGQIAGEGDSYSDPGANRTERTVVHSLITVRYQSRVAGCTTGARWRRSATGTTGGHNLAGGIVPDRMACYVTIRRDQVG
jgi:hypothetical protein